MADFDDIDALLSNSLKKAAEPAPSAGVADAIRTRVSAGDTGTSVASSTAPGWGGGATGILTIVAPLALVVVAGVVGAVLGVTGAFGSTKPPLPDGNIPAFVVTSDVATAFTCPGGASIDNIPANTRVLAVVRDQDGKWLGVRDPDDVERTLWVAAHDVVLDKGSADPKTLPVDGCPAATITLPQPVVTEAPVEPTTPPSSNPKPPTTPKDTTAPTITSISANPLVVINNSPSTITVAATDNVGVSSVTLTWTNANGSSTGSVSMPKAGSSWAYTWTNNGPSSTYGNFTFTAVANDAAGNHSAGAKVVVNQQYLG